MIKTVFISFLLLPLYVFSQGITADGKYVFAPVNRNTAIVVQSTEKSWKKEIKNHPFNASFLNNDQFIYQKNDSLFIQQLGSDSLKTITNVKSFQLVDGDRSKSIIYLLKDANNTLALEDPLSLQVKLSLQNIVDFLIDRNSQAVLIKQQEASGLMIKYLSLQDFQVSSVTEGDYPLRSFVFDRSGTQLVFMRSVKQGDEEENNIWYFKKGLDHARVLVSNNSKGIENNYVVSNNKPLSLLSRDLPFGFTPLGTKVFFRLEKKPDTTHVLPNGPNVDIWSYTDALIQSQQITWAFPSEWTGVQMDPGKWQPKYLAAIDVEKPDARVVKIQEDNEIVCGNYDGALQINDSYAVVCHFHGNMVNDFADEKQDYLGSDFSWSKATCYDISLVSLNNGQRQMVRSGIKMSSFGRPTYLLSPSGKYLLFYDSEKKSLVSYEVDSKKIINMSRIQKKWNDGNPEDVRGYYSAALSYRTHWLKGGNYLLVRDHYGDIWKIDVIGKTNSVNITCFLGQKDGIYFSVQADWRQPIDNNSNLILSAQKNTNRGFYLANLQGKRQPKKLLMGPYSRFGNVRLLMAASSENCIVQLESARIPKDTYYFTKGFIKFNPISGSDSIIYHPVDKEACHWKTFAGKEGFGLLYKPVDFDSTRKYPVIFSYYEQDASNHANDFEEYKPEAYIDNDFASANLLYCLNNGYIVFVPDIHYTLGSAGESVYDYVVSAAKYISKFSFVDSKKMGISGHSFGGWETNYLVTHSNLFAAACSGAGMTDMISYFGHIENDYAGYPFDYGQVRIGTTPWERPDLFIKNSPIFYADRVSTPLLLMANKNDVRVPYDQSIELFKALRRLGKRCWLLQYDNARHSLRLKEDSHDWGIRQMQFFDHYLKGAPAPVWMTRGIPAKQKGKTLGYEYDSTMKTPGPGLLMENDAALTPEQKELLKYRTTVSEDGRIIDVKNNEKATARKEDKR